MGDTPLEQLVTSVDPAMVVVTTVAEGVTAGCLLGFQSQCSIEPEQLCLGLSKANHTYRVALRAEHLAVHFLTEGDLALAERFGTTTGEDTDKFTGLDVAEGPGGLPLLAALPHRVVGRRTAMVDVGGDHALVVLSDLAGRSDGPFAPLRMSAVAHLEPGHEAEERAVAPEE